jgi:hypothetical protein
VNATDCGGDKILAVYAVNSELFAVYRTTERVAVQFADDPAIGQTQRKSLAPLNPIRGEINGLVGGWRKSWRKQTKTKSANYERRVADALIVALEGDVAGAQSLLAEIKSDLVDERTSSAQFLYLVFASITVLLSMGLAAIFACLPLGCLTDGVQTRPLWLACGAGAAGAFFSITLGIQNRTILTDLNMGRNTVDAVLRVAVGFIAAPLAICLLSLGLVSLSIGSMSIGAHAVTGAGYSWTLILVVGFIAGFSERLIPDLLAKASAAAAGSGGAASTGRAASARGGLPSGVAAAPIAEDACLSDNPVSAAEATSDEHLPAASGGVATNAPSSTGLETTGGGS